MSFDNVIAVYMPYCLQRQEDERYAILNREYKPLGFITKDWIKYDDYPVCARIKGIGPAMARKLSYKGSEDTDCIYLYNDGCNPCYGPEEMEAYLEKLSLLGKLRISEEISPVLGVRIGAAMVKGESR